VLWLREYIQKHIGWSLSIFGEGRRTDELLAHIEEEIAGVRANPTDVFEWIGIIILALDGAWRAGNSPIKIVSALNEKQTANFLKYTKK